jgi:hypothetical protein
MANWRLNGMFALAGMELPLSVLCIVKYPMSLLITSTHNDADNVPSKL